MLVSKLCNWIIFTVHFWSYLVMLNAWLCAHYKFSYSSSSYYYYYIQDGGQHPNFKWLIATTAVDAWFCWN